MKNLRFLAIFLAFGFVTYQLYNLNSKVRDENALSSLIEVYTVVSDGPLALRKGPGVDHEVVTRLNGKDSGKAAEVILISKENDEWWKIQYTNDEEGVIQGYASSEFLKLLQMVETFSLFWNETDKVFVEEDSSTCESQQVSFEESELVTLDLENFLSRPVEVIGSEDKMRLVAGSVLRRTKVSGEFEVLSSPVLSEDVKIEVASPGSIVKVKNSEVISLEGTKILVPDLSQHIEDAASIAESFEVESRGGKFTEYNCCFDGKACEKFIKLIPAEDALKEVLMFSYQKKSVYKMLQVRLDETEESSEEEGEDEVSEDRPEPNSEAYESQSPKTRKSYGASVEYTNYEDYFLGPKGVDNRTGGDVYRLNVQSGGGSVKNGPCGSYHYNPENLGGLVGGDRYIKKEVLGCFLATLQVFKKEHPRAKVQWGDISRGDRTSFRPDHSTHKDGRDVDLRPIRKDNELAGCRIGWKCYDREKTKAFIDIALRFGGEPVYFNDEEINKTDSKIQHSKGHADHFHIRYSRECTGVTLETKYCPRQGFN